MKLSTRMASKIGTVEVHTQSAALQVVAKAPAAVATPVATPVAPQPVAGVVEDGPAQPISPPALKGFGKVISVHPLIPAPEERS